jgi:hypothetical protein
VKRAIIAFAALMAISLIPVWILEFATQDGPAHLYSAEILRAELAGGDHPGFELRAEPMPNVLGHLLLAGLAALFGPPTADRIVISLTILGVGAAALLLRSAVRGPAGILYLAPLAAFVSVNRLWLLGFYSFLLGCFCFGCTAALMWRWRERLDLPRSAAISALLIIGYLAHPVSLAASIFALLVIGAFQSRRTLGRVGAASAPSILLLIYYVSQASERGAFRLEWWLSRPLVPRFLAISSSSALPLLEGESLLYAAVAPVLLFAAALAMTARNGLWREQRAFLIVAAVLFAGALLGPDGLGSEHGGFLRQRLFALGVIAAAPLWQFPPRLRSFAFASAVAACVLQSAFVLEYALRSDAVVKDLLAREAEIGPGATVLPLVVTGKTQFLASPEQHASNLLGIGNSRTMFGNYEAELYYFPVRFERPLRPCPDDELPRYDAIEIDGFTKGKLWQSRRFVCTAIVNHGRLDTLLTWGAPAEALRPFLDRYYRLAPPIPGTKTDLWFRRDAPSR